MGEKMGSARHIYGSILLQSVKTILHKPTGNSGINIFYIKNVYINIIYNFYKKAYSVKQTVFIKQELFFEKLNFLQNLDCTGSS